MSTELRVVSKMHWEWPHPCFPLKKKKSSVSFPFKFSPASVIWETNGCQDLTLGWSCCIYLFVLNGSIPLFTFLSSMIPVKTVKYHSMTISGSDSGPAGVDNILGGEDGA